jgi:hypothetical protein
MRLRVPKTRFATRRLNRGFSGTAVLALNVSRLLQLTERVMVNSQFQLLVN